MDSLFELMPLSVFAAAMAICFVAGVVKGMVGFALPLIIISGLGSLADPKLALAGLLFPTVVSNVWQALRQGPRAAWASVGDYRTFLITGGISLVLSAQLVRFLPTEAMLLLIGVPVTTLTALQIMGWRPAIPAHHRPRAEAMAGLIAGAMGGFSGTWGPATVLFLVALNTPKQDQIRVQGVVFGLGALVLVAAHSASGVLNAQTLPFALATLPPALAGMWAGLRLSDRIDQNGFRTATLWVLLLAGLNLIRKGMIG